MKKELCAMAIAMCLMTTSYGVVGVEAYGDEIKGSREIVPEEEPDKKDAENKFVCSIDELHVNTDQDSFFYIDLVNDAGSEDIELDISDENSVKVERSTFEKLSTINEEIKSEIEKIGDDENRIWFKVTGVNAAEGIRCIVTLNDYSAEVRISVHNQAIENNAINIVADDISIQSNESTSPSAKSKNSDGNTDVLSFSKSEIKASAGQTIGFLVYSENGTPTVTTESSSIATAKVISGNYKGNKTAYYCEVTAKSAGTTNIVAKRGSKSGELAITVSAPSFSLSKSGTQNVGTGQTIGFLVYTSSKSGTAPKVTSSNISVAKAVYNKTKDARYKNGYYMEVTGLKEGTATITVDYYGAKKSFSVKIAEKTPSFSKSGIKASAGQTIGFLVYSENGMPTVTTESSSIATAKVISGNYKGNKTAYYCEVTAKSAGTTNIVAKRGSKSGKLAITVSAPSFSLSKSGTQNVGTGQTIGFLVYTSSKSGTAPKVTSSNTSVAKAVYNKTKDARYKNGYYMEVTGLKEGTATITVDYYGAKKSFNVKVIKTTGWVTINGSKYYIEADGDYATGYRDIGGFKYYFNSKGVLSSKVGIDVSAYQSSVNWTAVKNSGVDFVIIRVGYTGWGTGSINLDSKFTSHINGALAAGLDVGVYYYSQAITVAEARKEADFVAQKIAPYKSSIKYPVVFDTESTGAGGRGDKLTKAARTQIAKAFCDRVKSYGYTPMIYSNLSWLNNNLDMNLLLAYPVWVAQYYSVNQYSRPYKCWQYTSSGSVSGISGRVDLNVWLN